MAREGASSLEEEVLEHCIQSQSMIDITADKLYALRGQLHFRASEDLIKREIKESESKIIKLVCRQLVAKAKLKSHTLPPRLNEYPQTAQWFSIVGINAKVAERLVAEGVQLSSLLAMSSTSVETLLQRHGASQDDIRMLNAALTSLKRWTDSELGKGDHNGKELHWSSYKSSSSGAGSSSYSEYLTQRPSTSSLPPEPPPPPMYQPPLTPPPQSKQQTTPTKKHFPATPPPKRRNKLHPDVFHPLSKSKSHESQLSVKVNQEANPDMLRYLKKKPDNLTITGSTGSFDALNQRKRSAGDVSVPTPPNALYTENQLGVPVSPNTPLVGQNRSMWHSIKHGFVTKLVFGACDFCHKKVLRKGRVCKHCKQKFHRECAKKTAPTCCLPEEYLDAFIAECQRQDGSPGPARHFNSSGGLVQGGSSASDLMAPPPNQPDSSSTTSSCTSSNPSSPATLPPSAQPSPQIHITDTSSTSASSHRTPHATQFHFPDSCTTSSSSFSDSLGSMADTIGTVHSLDSGIEKSDIINTNTSNDSDKSDKTLVDTGGTGSSGLERTDSVDSTSEDGGGHWNRVHSISVVLKEWDIPFEEITIGKMLGQGQIGKVYKGNWHGDVAIKMLNMETQTETDSQLAAFKLEVATLRKTRHENLVLFMGACMRPPHHAIITSLCKGHTLYNFLHMRGEKMQMNKNIIVASQIAQGMGYLHAKNIVHKDLKSKNIFLETGRAVITDFGLFNVTKLCHGSRKGEWLNIPKGWLCYLAPEIMRSLQAGGNEHLPFSTWSDVFAFGTVWYELVSGEWPFRQQPPEAVIWQVGKGIKNSAPHLQLSQDVKDVLLQCWAYRCTERADFGALLKLLERLPKKRLARSPSHPLHLSRSAESVF